MKKFVIGIIASLLILSIIIAILIAIVNKTEKITDWNLKLVNSQNLLPEDFEVDLVELYESKSFDKRAIKELNQMIIDMKKDGITNIYISSAYRSIEEQRKLYENRVYVYIKQGVTRQEAEQVIQQVINKPRASEHHLGLAVDFNSVEEDFKETDAYEWLVKNAENYGFILRYPEEKMEITGIIYEPWHWRYVGEEHAKEMNRMRICLEEYIEYLEEKKKQEIWNIFKTKGE